MSEADFASAVREIAKERGVQATGTISQEGDYKISFVQQNLSPRWPDFLYASSGEDALEGFQKLHPQSIIPHA